MTYFGRNRLYLLLVYLSMSLLFVPLILALDSFWLRYPGLVLFIVLLLFLHDALVRAVQQVAGTPAMHSELENFSAVLEMNKSMYDLMDTAKIVALTELTLQKQLHTPRIHSFINRRLLDNDQDEGFECIGQGRDEAEEAWLSAACCKQLLAIQRIVSAPVQQEDLAALLRVSNSDVVLPLIQNKMLLGVILLQLPEGKTGCTAVELTMLDYLARQLGIILDRIRVYRQVMKQKEMAYAEKMKIMESISSNIAHEMRTPLSGIRANISGVETYLPQLLQAYEQCLSRGQADVGSIREDHLATLRNTPERITLMIDQANAVIDLLLMNLRNNALDPRQLTYCSAAVCLEQALDRYPFKSGEKALVHVDTDNDFHFLGIDSLFIYIIFNLLKNSLYSIRSAGKGEIRIWLESHTDHNALCFRDTGEGIDETEIEKIFDSFYTSKEGGTGAGLAFCKRTMESFGGSIVCRSIKGEFCEFELRLPKVEMAS